MFLYISDVRLIATAINLALVDPWNILLFHSFVNYAEKKNKKKRAPQNCNMRDKSSLQLYFLLARIFLTAYEVI